MYALGRACIGAGNATSASQVRLREVVLDGGRFRA
jgi:hypothetical protein